MNVSIIIPCHNAEPYLAQAVGSALEQTHLPHEVIVVDDGSTDGSLGVARRLRKLFPQRVRVIAQRAGRASRTRNIGAFAATGDALMFLDADDVLGADALAALTAVLAREPRGVAVCPWYRLERAGEQWISKPATCAPRRPGQAALGAWLRGWYHPPCSVLWSREAFEAVGRWDERWNPNDDGDLMMRALAIGAPLVSAETGAAYYRRLPEGETSLSSRRFSAAGLRARLRTIEKIAAWLAERGTQAGYRDDLRHAFEQIAGDAREHDAEVHAQAQTQARQCPSTTWTRTWARLRPLAPPQPAPFPGRPKKVASEPITCGLSTAARVKDLPPPSAPLPEEEAPPARPLVTVLIPAYNRARLLPRTLDSVLAQTFGDFEVLVVDDGSTDDTAAVVNGYTARDARVRYLPQPRNAGVGAARNRGLREARGEFIAFLDSDDEWMADKLALQVEQFRHLPEEVGLTYTGVETVFDDGTRLVERPQHRGDVYQRMLLRNVIHGGGSNAMIRRNVVATAGFFDEGMPAIEDYDYWLRITRFFHVDYIDVPLMRYHDPRTADRRSQAVAANLAARAWLYRKHKTEMQRVGVANGYLRESIRRALAAPRPDTWGARRVAARALLDAPSRETLGMLRRTLLPQRPRQPAGARAGGDLAPGGWSNA